MLPTFYNDRFILLMTVKGRKQSGLVIDPGAAKGVIGSDTLKEIQDIVLTPRNLLQCVIWKASQSRFSGISSTQECSLGVVGIPIGLQGVPKSIFCADVLGGTASMCPGLVPLHTLIRSAEFLHFAFFRNGDGVLGVRHAGQISPQRLFLTDSGHYLMRIDLFDMPVDYKLNEHIANRLYNQLTNIMPSRSVGPSWRTSQVARRQPTVALPVFAVSSGERSSPQDQDFQ